MSAHPQVSHICITRKVETLDQPWEKKRGHWKIYSHLSLSQYTDVVRAEPLHNMMTTTKASHQQLSTTMRASNHECPTTRTSHHQTFPSSEHTTTTTASDHQTFPSSECPTTTSVPPPPELHRALLFFQAEPQTTEVRWCQTQAGGIEAHQRPILAHFLLVWALLAQTCCSGESAAAIRQAGLEARREQAETQVKSSF